MLCEAGRGLRVGDISRSWSAATGGTAAAKLLVRPVCAGVGLALQIVIYSTDGFSAGAAVWPWVQFDVSGE